MARALDRVTDLAGRTLTTLADLVLPSDCAGCGDPARFSGVCATCVRVLEASPGESRPTPPPAGLPRCVTLGPYDGAMRQLILAYKESGRRGLAAPLGDGLARVVAVAAGEHGAGPIVLVPVPGTAAAIRARQGDHMLRLARRAARRLTRSGWEVAVATPLRARPKADSAHLDRHARARVALDAFAVRRSRAGALRRLAGCGVIVVLDDVLTTGSTLAAVASRLAGAGITVDLAATLAATRLRRVASLSPIGQNSSPFLGLGVTRTLNRS